MTFYVWFEGKTYRNTLMTDYRGYLHLVNWKDTSQGVSAPLDKVRPCSEEEHKAIEYFISKF